MGLDLEGQETRCGHLSFPLLAMIFSSYDGYPQKLMKTKEASKKRTVWPLPGYLPSDGVGQIDVKNAGSSRDVFEKKGKISRWLAVRRDDLSEIRQT
jgi:hypothetical protein